MTRHQGQLKETLEVQRNLIQNIKIRLTLKDLSQKDLAEGVGISVPSVSLKMTGRTSWTLDDITRVSQFLHTPISVLLSPPSLTPTEAEQNLIPHDRPLRTDQPD